MRKLVTTVKTLTWLDDTGRTSTIYVSQDYGTNNLAEDAIVTDHDSSKSNEDDIDEVNIDTFNKSQEQAKEKFQLRSVKKNVRETKMSIEFERIETVENIYYE